MAKSRKKSSATPRRQPRILAQAGVVPYRQDAAGAVWVMLIRRRHKRRWGIPKGVIEPGDTAPATALREALEEAGITGELDGRPLGKIEYAKWGCTCRVAVYAMRVTHQNEHYEEENIRERQWLPLSDAADRRTRKGVRNLMVEMVRRLATQAAPQE